MLNRTLVSNIGRAIIKKLAVKFEGNEILSIDDYDLLVCYRDLWKTKSEKRNAIWPPLPLLPRRQISRVWHIPATWANSCQMASSELPWTFYFNKFYIFPPLSRSHSLEYLPIHMEGIYIYQLKTWENGKLLKLIHHSQIPAPQAKLLSNCGQGGGNSWNWLIHKAY